MAYTLCHSDLVYVYAYAYMELRMKGPFMNYSYRQSNIIMYVS